MIPILFFYIPGWCSSHNFYVTLVSKKYFMSLDFHPLSLADGSLVWRFSGVSFLRGWTFGLSYACG